MKKLLINTIALLAICHIKSINSDPTTGAFSSLEVSGPAKVGSLTINGGGITSIGKTSINSGDGAYTTTIGGGSIQLGNQSADVNIKAKMATLSGNARINTTGSGPTLIGTDGKGKVEIGNNSGGTSIVGSLFISGTLKVDSLAPNKLEISSLTYQGKDISDKLEKALGLK